MQPRHASSRSLDLGVLGAGYVGLVTAACLAERGHRLTVIDVDSQRLAALGAGRVPFHEPGLQPLLDEALRSNRLTAAESPLGLAGADAVLVCVGTPLDEHGNADLSQVESACRSIARHAPNAVVVIRSTLPLGSSDLLSAWLNRRHLTDVVTNPEFLRQGSAVSDFRSPTRIVIGTRDGQPSAASRLVERLYAGTDAPVLVTTYQSADLIKNAANAFLATKLSFINEVADLCEVYDADIEQVVEGIGLDPRIGRGYLRPGIGFGGSCLPKELSNLAHLGESRGLPVRLMQAAGRDNGNRAARICGRLERLVGSLAHRRVALLGLSFKPNTDDVRYSPAVALARHLLARRARVVAHDPVVPFERTADVRRLERAATVDAAVHQAEMVVLATEWPEYVDLDWERLRSVVSRPLIFDGRNALDRQRLESAGWTVIRIGQSSRPLVRGGKGKEARRGRQLLAAAAPG